MLFNPFKNNASEAYLKSLGYKQIEHFEKDSHSYILTKEMLIQLPYNYIWGVQESSPELYLGKEISVERFSVKNHPLNQLYLSTTSKSIDVFVEVYLINDEVIGGISIPSSQNGETLFGAIYSIEGKSIEELTGLSYAEWTEQWNQKFKN